MRKCFASVVEIVLSCWDPPFLSTFHTCRGVAGSGCSVRAATLVRKHSELVNAINSIPVGHLVALAVCGETYFGSGTDEFGSASVDLLDWLDGSRSSGCTGNDRMKTKNNRLYPYVSIGRKKLRTNSAEYKDNFRVCKRGSSNNGVSVEASLTNANREAIPGNFKQVETSGAISGLVKCESDELCKEGLVTSFEMYSSDPIVRSRDEERGLSQCTTGMTFKCERGPCPSGGGNGVTVAAPSGTWASYGLNAPVYSFTSSPNFFQINSATGVISLKVRWFCCMHIALLLSYFYLLCGVFRTE